MDADDFLLSLRDKNGSWWLKRYFTKNSRMPMFDFLSIFLFQTVKCEICQKMIRKKDIVYHVKTHKGLNKDWCSFCGKEFNSKGAKKRHEKIHTSDKKHSCSYCGKSFVQKVNMESHERIHTGVKPYKCRFCGEGFVQGTRRNQHQASCPQRSQEAAEAAVASVQQPQDPSLLLQQHEALVEFKT